MATRLHAHLALAVAATLVAAGSASAASDCSFSFRNPYASPVTVDLRQSKVQLNILTTGNGYTFGPKRRIGTGTLRVKAASTRQKTFRFPLGEGCDDTRRYTWVITYRGDRYQRVITTALPYTIPVKFPDFAGMPRRPPVRTPILVDRFGQTIQQRPLIRWRGGRVRNGTYPWELWRRYVSPTTGRYARSKVAEGTARRQQVRIPSQPNGEYKFHLWQQDGAGYRSSRVTLEFTIEAPLSQPRS